MPCTLPIGLAYPHTTARGWRARLINNGIEYWRYSRGCGPVMWRHAADAKRYRLPDYRSALRANGI
jgi:hypothetical protein